MSRADLNLRSKGTDHAKYPSKPKRTAARIRDRKVKALTPRVRRTIAARSLAIRSTRAKAANAARIEAAS